MTGFDRFLIAGFPLDEHARKLFTAPAPTGQSDLAPALVQQRLQPIMLKRQRPNPSRRVKNFRQGLSRAGLGCGPFWTSIRVMLDDTDPHTPPDALPGTTGHLLAP